MLRAEGLGKRYRRTWALRDCTLTLSAYEACGWLAAGRTDSGPELPRKIEFVKHRVGM